MSAILEIRNLSAKEKAVVEAMLRFTGPVSQRDLMSKMTKAPSQASMSRIMSSLIAKQILIKEGETKGARFSLTADARRVATDPRRRTPLPYDPCRIGGYVPNQSRWLPEPAAARMRAAVDAGGGQKLDASTYSKAIAERFLVDLAWASSNLEGNTYDHLSTEVLIKYGESASGRDRMETAMILNHKAAISAMLDGLDGKFPDAHEVQRRHVLMMRDLMDASDLGAIRRTSVQITATSYRPSSDHALLVSGLSDLLAKASEIKEPFEATFVLLAGVSYLQAFGDGNKRMGRLLSNEPLLRAGLPPLSFIGVDKTPYILGLIDFYEVGSTGVLADAIVQSYDTTAADYIRSITVQRIPHALELRERAGITKALGTIFRDRVPDNGILNLVLRDFQHLDDQDRDMMVAILIDTSRRASPISAFLYGVTEEDIVLRNAKNREAPPDSQES